MNASNELYTNCIERLNEIIALFSARRARYSVLDISEMLNIPVSVVRNDIVSIHTCRELPLT